MRRPNKKKNKIAPMRVLYGSPDRPVEKGGKGGSFPWPRDVWGPPSLKNTENGVPDGFFLTQNMHKIYFRPGLCPGPRWGAYDAPPNP